MTKKKVELEVGPTGTMRAYYDDSVAGALKKLGSMSVKRASNVEYEKGKEEEGWTVRAAHDPELAIRVILEGACFKRVVSKTGDLLFFNTREDALDAELTHFWELLPPGDKT